MAKHPKLRPVSNKINCTEAFLMKENFSSKLIFKKCISIDEEIPFVNTIVFA